MEDKRYYQKNNPEKELLQPDVSSKKPVAMGSGDSMLIPLSRYTKPEPSLFPHALFVVYSGGTKREKDYFHLIERNPESFPSVKIDFSSEPNFDAGGKPTIMQVAIEKTEERQNAANKDNPEKDNYFLLTDVDHFE